MRANRNVQGFDRKSRRKRPLRRPRCRWEDNIKLSGSRVFITTGYGLDDRGVVVHFPIRSRIFTSPYHPDQLWCPPSLLSNGYGYYLGSKAALA
jgi:hypothetical protein